jgi:hypothetical protein
MKTFPDIDRLKATLDSHRPLDPAMVRNLREDLVVRWDCLGRKTRPDV